MRNELRLAIIIPLCASIATGLFSGLLVLTLAVWRGWPVVYAFIVAAALAFISWLSWSSRFAYLIEYKLARDLHQVQAQQTAIPPTVNLHINREDEGGYIEGAFLDRLPVGADTLATLADQVISGQPLTTSSMISNGLDRRTWEILRDRFVSAGLLAWRGGSRFHGCYVTGKGLAVFRRMASRPTPPPGAEVGEMSPMGDKLQASTPHTR